VKYLKYFFIALALGFASIAYSQDTTADLTASVQTASGADINNATVSVTNIGTGLSRSAVSTGGSVRFAALPPGNYSVTSSAPALTSVSSEITILAGSNSYSIIMTSVNAEDLTVRGEIIKSYAFEVTETGINVDVEDLYTKTPQFRGLNSIVLLAPGTSEGDSAFGGLASISGSSSGENQYYVNGLNITNFRNFLGYSNVPFEFYDSVDVKTGGYQAEFGKATGGVIYGTTKSGSNDFEMKISSYYMPDALRWDSPDTFAAINSQDVGDSFVYNVSFSGAVVPDRLFYYVLAQPESSKFQNAGFISEEQYVDSYDDTFYGAKIDAYLNDNNILEITHFSDKSRIETETFNYDPTTFTRGTSKGLGYNYSGGENTIVNFTSNINENWTVNVLYGKNEAGRTVQSSQDTCPAVYDRRTTITGGSFVPKGCWVNWMVTEGSDEREVGKVTAEVTFDNHIIKFGYESEDLQSISSMMQSGGNYYLLIEPDYLASTAQLDAFAASGLSDTQELVRKRTYLSGGNFKINNTAIFVQGNFELTDKWNLNAGLRSDNFNNMNAAGESFVKLDNQVAYRIGATFDVNGDGSEKFGIFAGTYYLPIAANTNIRLSGAETFVHEFYRLDGIDDSQDQFFPVFDPTTLFHTDTFSSGVIPDKSELVDTTIEPMYANEFIMTYDWIQNDWNLGVALTYRDLGSTIEDIAVDRGVLAYCTANGLEGCEDNWTGFHHYVLTNPGTNLSYATDELPGGESGTFQKVDMTAEQLGFPEVERVYQALDFTFAKDWDDVYFIEGSVTLSTSKGNYEGSVKSDNGQDDAGLTQDFDAQGLTDNSYGFLPNHRDYRVKVFGGYQATDSLVLGFNASLTAPRKFGCLGTHPTDTFAQQYGDDSWFCAGVATPRGTVMESDTIFSLDFSMAFDLGSVGIIKESLFKIDIFNVLGQDGVDDLYEYGESGGPSSYPYQYYQLPTSYQYPRSIRLGIEAKF
jgi:hypothetical protein